MYICTHLPNIFSKMEYFIKDVVCYLCEYLDDYQKIHFFSICKRMNKFKKDVSFDQKIQIKKIISLSYFNNFKNIIALTNTIYPNNVVNLTIPFNEFDGNMMPKTLTHLRLIGSYQTFLTPIPSSVTHLSFGDHFNQPIKCIPSSVTHLAFGRDFNRSINGCIPDSVTYLTFGRNFNQSIKGCIPLLIKHINFGKYFDQPIDNCLSESLTHLKFGTLFSQPIENHIPHSVTHLRLGYYQKHQIDGIPSTVIHLTLACNFFDDDESAQWKNIVPKNIKNLVIWYFDKINIWKQYYHFE
uniref:FNIP repeat-containing protein n=1 Tax=viral metagenome TaxID=1070528 RepID=A0A6C0C967_9ZZZZ